MKRKRLISCSLILLIPLLLAGIIGLSIYFEDLPNHISQHETFVLGQNRLTPGSQAALRVVVRDSKDGSPLPNSSIEVALQPQDGGRAQVVFQGQTDAQGTANVSFNVPADAAANQTLIVKTHSKLGSDTVERPVTLERDYRILVTTDKPIYQPGQVIHLRALALSTFDLTPANAQEIEIIIADGKGNKVFRKKLTTSAYGVAATDFQLASEVNSGAYKITAILGNTSSEKTVTVEHYVLPKFAVEMQTERTYYQPGQHVQGSLKANYFFGKPVAGGQVSVEGYTYDVQQNLVFSLQGVTDDAGNFTFEFDLPAYIAGSDLEGGLGRFYLQASVTDLAQHSETSNLSLPVSGSALVIEAIPEGGQFRPGVENILYVLVSYPNGAPANAGLSITFSDSGQTMQIETGEYGLAEVHYTPPNPWSQFTIQAQDAQGNIAQRDFYFEGEYSPDSVLLRPEKPVYQVGEAMHLTILTSQAQGTVYLDIVREGQTVSTRSVEMKDGKAEVIVDLTPDLYGTLELHAYKILSSGTITRDTRLVVVDNAAGLDLSLTPGKEIYLPGETANVDLQVNGNDGAGVQSAVGVAIVDESVFALAEQDPGFAKLYFLLEQELLQPKYDLHGFSIPELMQGTPVEDPQLRGAIEDTAQASLAAAAPKGELFSLNVNSHLDALNRANQRQGKYFANLSTVLFGIFLLLPLGVLSLSAYPLWKEKTLWRSLGAAIGLLALIILLILFWPVHNADWVRSPLERIGVFLDWLGYSGGTLLLILALLGVVGLISLIVIAWRRKDALLGWSLGLIPVFLAVMVLMVFAVTRGGNSPSNTPIIAGLIAFALLPLAFLLRSMGFAWNRQAFASLAAFFVSGLLLFATIPAVALSTSGVGSRMAAPVPAPMERLGVGGELVEEAMPLMDAGVVVKEVEKQAESTSSTSEPPRLRQYFPETMLWLPEAVTDETGRLHLDFPVADSITTWRITALASSQDGRLGSATSGLRVFQDFFIDLDLPLALTIGDQVSIPVGVFNYLTEAQTVRLELAQADWFELLDEPVKEMTIAANDISVVYFRVKAVKFGNQPFKVMALGSQMSDAIQKEVQVFPDGKQISFTQSDRLTAGAPIRQAIDIPPEAIPGTPTLQVKIYPGILSQVVEGLDSILRMPYGCFEQTSSTTYPNVLVLDYLKATNQASPEAQMKAEEYINLGYQRLTTFEVQSSGGFSLFGDPPADRMLTAYGLQEFADMSRVHDVDPALIQRAAEWLLAQQTGDGAWENDRGLVHENTWSSLGDDRLPVTAYIVWSLVEAGYGEDARTQKGLSYVRDNQSKAEDPYVVALVANALIAADLKNGGDLSSTTQAVFERLAGLAKPDGSGAYWESSVATFMGSEGQTGSIETTALAALAFLRSNTHPELGNAALTYLVRQKDNSGTWYTTQATVLALKALIQSIRAGAEQVNATVTISLNGGQALTVQVTPENFDVVQMISFEEVKPGQENLVEINVSGKGNLMYQVTGSYYLPWDQLVRYPELVDQQEPVTIDVAYDRTEIAINDTVEVKVTVSLNEPGGKVESALIDLGLPPGFSVLSEDLEALVARYNDVPQDYALPTLQRFELTGRQILIYISNLTYGNPMTFTYRLRAKFPLVAQAPASATYDYYNPEVAGEARPQVITVNP
jgi:uncharacterized protein YfaS (alpha-2-macroglobulin family)